MAKRWPIVFPGYELTCFLNTKVACQRITVMPTNKLCSDDFQDVGEAMVIQDAVDVLPVLDQLFRPKLASVFVFVLQLLQPQSNAADNIGPFLGQLFS